MRDPEARTMARTLATELKSKSGSSQGSEGSCPGPALVPGERLAVKHVAIGHDLPMARAQRRVTLISDTCLSGRENSVEKINGNGRFLLMTQAGAELGDPDSQYALGVLYANLLEDGTASQAWCSVAVFDASASSGMHICDGLESTFK